MDQQCEYQEVFYLKLQTKKIAKKTSWKFDQTKMINNGISIVNLTNCLRLELLLTIL